MHEKTRGIFPLGKPCLHWCALAGTTELLYALLCCRVSTDVRNSVYNCLCAKGFSYICWIIPTQWSTKFWNLILFIYSFGTGVWTRGLHLEPVHQPYFCDGFFEKKLFAQGWLRTSILLISASWVLGSQAWAICTWLFYLFVSFQCAVFQFCSWNRLG
jgi:hypothetical protein